MIAARPGKVSVPILAALACVAAIEVGTAPLVGSITRIPALHAARTRGNVVLSDSDGPGRAAIFARASASASSSPPGVPAPTGGEPARDAWYYLNSQLELGPRNPGSEGHRKVREFLVSELSKYADEVSIDDFQTRYEGCDYPMTNVSALFRSVDGSEEPFIILAAHFDTRPRAELDPDVSKRSLPIPGANDGASGTAVLLEIAGALARRSPPIPVLLAFFDGEDFGPGVEWMFLGSRRLAQQVDPSSVICMILLDMVGDLDLDIYVEGNSWLGYPDLARAVWASASRLGYGDVFHDEVRHYVLDDHVPFVERGIPALDVIDFDYPYWHTTLDTADKCSAVSLRIVRDVVLDAIFGGEVERLRSER